MLRGDNIVCGTTTTGTGTLTLAATPGPPGGVDFDVFARATGIGFGNSAAVIVSYTIIEYTDATFATAKATEKGAGTLTLGGSSGIANCTLARTTKQTSATSLNSQPATQNIAPGTGISIGTAANTLVFIGASAADVPAFEPYVQTAVGDTNWGALPLSIIFSGSNLADGGVPSTGVEIFQPFIWLVPMLVKRCTVRVTTAYTGGVPVSNADIRLYAVGTDGRPGKLLLDLGILGSANASFNSTGNVSTQLHANGYFLTPGEYYLAMPVVFSGGSGGPGLLCTNTVVAPRMTSGRYGAQSGLPNTNGFNLSAAIGAAPDPATVTSWSMDTTCNVASRGFQFGLSAT